MYYTPKYFRPEEIFSQAYFKQTNHKGNKIWRMMDGRILWTADEIRKHFCGVKRHNAEDSMTVNNWLWGGSYHLRGYRDIWIDIKQGEKIFSKTSQHCFGRALDYSFEKTTAEEVRADILNNPDAARYKYISGIELNVSWNHNDIRCWDKVSHGILAFNKA